MKLSIRENMAPGETVPEKLAWLERVGLDGMELHSASMKLQPDELVAVFAGSPVRASAIEGIPKLLDPDPAERAAVKDAIRARLELAARLGAVGVLVVPQFGRKPALPDLTPFHTAVELETELFVAQLAELAPTARAAGVSLFQEPLNRYEAYLVNRLEQGVAFGERVGPEIGVMADFFHMNIEEADIPASIRAAGNRLVYVHTADSNRQQPGMGHLDFRPGFAALKGIGYDGWIALECRVVGLYDDAIRETAAFLRAEWDAA
jgi:sugar phosphate isomerase/epimerase